MTAPSVPCRERWPMGCYQKWWGRTPRKAGCREPTESWPALSVHFLPGVQDPSRGSVSTLLCLQAALFPRVPQDQGQPPNDDKTRFFKCLNLFANK